MTGQSVCAVVVSYHPNSSSLQTLPKILGQVSGLVVVDNGSAAGEVVQLRIASQSLGFHLIENKENLGIAEALNQGACWAKNNGHEWVVFFDQDSEITGSFIETMFAAWESHPQRERVASVHPRYVDPATGLEPFIRRAVDGGPVMAMTSGALMPLWIFEKIGWFAPEYFIDCVDFEYCLRIRAAGCLVADARNAVLLHAAGHADKSNSLFGFSFRPTHYNAARRYYISRNRIALYRKYFRVFPRWILQSMYDSLRETIKCFVSERERLPKFRSFMLGTWDGLTGRMGKRNVGSEAH
jgi:rhamnosyltransferase